MNVLNVPPAEDWHGEGGTISQVTTALEINSNQHQRILNIVAKTHHAMLTGVEYDSMREFRGGSTTIKLGSIEEQTVTDYREQDLSYTETTLLIN